MAAKEIPSEEGSFKNEKGLNICFKIWNPDNREAKGLIYICHGYADHYRRYEKEATAFANAGFIVASHDFVGHGKSEGDRAITKNCNEYVETTEQHVKLLTDKYPSLPIFMFGYSMGGWVALKFALNNPVLLAGMVIVGAMVVPSPDTATPFKVRAVKIITKVWSSCPVGTLEGTYMSRDPDVVKNMEDDPLCYHGYMRACTGLAMLNAMSETNDRLSEIKTPILIIHGGDDKIVLVEGSEKVAKSVSSEDKTLSVYKDCYHRVFNEPEGDGERCMKEICDWILQRA